LAAASVFEEDPGDEIKSSGDLGDALSLAIPKRNRTSRNPTTLPSKSSGYPKEDQKEKLHLRSVLIVNLIAVLFSLMNNDFFFLSLASLI
jgi:hypothetical protein